MERFEYGFETDDGWLTGNIPATNYADATAKLKAMYPDDIGSDGCWYLDDGTEKAIDW